MESKPFFEAEQLNENLRVAPWEGHRLFSYDYIRNIHPKKIVELGTHYGCSFFSFCQAVKDSSLETELLAVDTWNGDEQAGYYEQEVYETVKKTVDTYYSDIKITLLKMTFDRALSLIEDNSIDLLHIDGLHTYEAVKHDFESWLPKLSGDGVVFFHDVFSPLEYGSNTYWEEIKGIYPSLEFKHSWGLGILFPKGNAVLDKLIQINIYEKLNYYTYKSKFLLERIKNKDLSGMVNERDEVIAKLEGMIEERDKALKKSEFMIEERDKALKTSKIMIEERDSVIKASENMIDERDKALKSSEIMIMERDKTLTSVEKIVIEKDNLIKNMQELITVKDESINLIKSVNINLQEDIKNLRQKEVELKNIIEYYENKKFIFNFKKK